MERKTVRRAGEGMAEFSQELMEVITEQTRDNALIFQALAQPANWGQAAQLQSEFLQASLKRTAQLTRRYVEIGQAVMSSALSTAWGQVKKAA